MTPEQPHSPQGHWEQFRPHLQPMPTKYRWRPVMHSEWHYEPLTEKHLQHFGQRYVFEQWQQETGTP